MSVHICYYFNYPKDPQELASDINMWIGCNLSPVDDDKDYFHSRYLSMQFSLSPQDGLLNDGELDFENFGYQLCFRTAVGTANARPIQLPALLIIVYALHHSLGIAGMLVYDVEKLLAKYVEREVDSYGKMLFDVVSNSPFIGFGAHLDLVRKQLPQDWQDFYGYNRASW